MRLEKDSKINIGRGASSAKTGGQSSLANRGLHL
jgi:hypothetical protein